MTEAAAPPKRRALPFKRTVARRQQSEPTEEPKRFDEDNDLDLFRHSKDMFSEVLREAEEEDQDQHDSKKRKVGSDDEDEPRVTCKQSITLDGSDDDLIVDVKRKEKEIIRLRRSSRPMTPTPSKTPRTPGSRTTPGTPASKRSASKLPEGSATSLVTVIDSSSSDEAQPRPPRPTRVTRQTARRTLTPKPQNLPNSNKNNDDSDEFEILSSSPIPQHPAAAPDEFSEWISRARALQSSTNTQTIIRILVTSQLPGATTPVLVERRLNQTVQLLLDVWIATTRSRGVDIPDDIAAALFLTWKGNKIYGHSTLASLGVQVDEETGRVRGTGEGYLRGGVVLEVWTEGAFEEVVGEKERGRRMGLSGEGFDGAVGDGEGDGEEEVQAVQAQRKRGIKVVLKAREHEPLKMMAKEETNVAMMVEAFRGQKGVGPEWDVSIHFDGERLDDESLVTELDIDPDEVNQFEVHVKKRA